VEILLGILAILVFGIVPMVIYALILWWFDRYEKEPVLLLVAAFVWGAVPSIIFSLIAEIVLDIPIAALVDPAAAMLVGVAVIAPVVEEFFKSTVLWLWLAAGIVNRLLLRFAPQVFENTALRVVLWILFPPFFREIDSALDGII
jgi:RsiW-degrading membrane proteinase PrsW (M82 family)